MIWRQNPGAVQVQQLKTVLSSSPLSLSETTAVPGCKASRTRFQGSGVHLTGFGQGRRLPGRVAHHSDPLTPHTEDLVGQIGLPEGVGQGRVRPDVGAEHGAVDVLQERLHEAGHAVVKLVVPEHLRDTKDRVQDQDLKDQAPERFWESSSVSDPSNKTKTLKTELRM